MSSSPARLPAAVWEGQSSGAAFADMLCRRAEQFGVAVEVEVQPWSNQGGYGVSADWGESSDAEFFCEVADWVDGVRIFDAGDDDVSITEALDYFHVLSVTPKQPLDPDRWFGDVPVDVAAALIAAGQPVKAGLWRPRAGQCRLLFQLSGRDRVEQGQRLEDALRELGYDADVSIGR